MKFLRKKLLTHDIKFFIVELYIIGPGRDVNVFIFQKNDSIVMKTMTKNRKQNDRFWKRSVF